jgi:transposase
MKVPDRALNVPDNITVLLLPPYSPELNPVERLWAYLRSHFLANRVYEDHQALLDAGAEVWRKLPPKVLRSVCACGYITHESGR